jgi:hypothetical protein
MGQIVARTKSKQKAGTYPMEDWVPAKCLALGSCFLSATAYGGAGALFGSIRLQCYLGTNTIIHRIFANFKVNYLKV